MTLASSSTFPAAPALEAGVAIFNRRTEGEELMAMFHHDSRPYPVAAAEAARAVRPRLEKMIEDGRAKAASVVEALERRQPVDTVVPAWKTSFDLRAEDGFLEMVADDDHRWTLHANALGQVCERAGAPHKFVSELLLRPTWGRELAADVLTRLFAHLEKRLLVRAVDGQARGVLSDSYRRLDSRPIFDAWIKAVSAVDALPTGGEVTETRLQLRAVLPMIFEPIPNEPCFFGTVISNSDFGDGRLSARLAFWRAWCTNLAIREEGLSLVHLGKRISEDAAFSERTYRLDTATTASAVGDVVKRLLSPASIEAELENIRRRDAETIDEKGAGAVLRARGLGRGEADAVLAAFKSPDVVNLPPNASVYRLSNAVSWIAQGADVAPRRRLDLVQIAGDILASTEERRREERIEAAVAA